MTDTTNKRIRALYQTEDKALDDRALARARRLVSNYLCDCGCGVFDHDGEHGRCLSCAECAMFRPVRFTVERAQ